MGIYIRQKGKDYRNRVTSKTNISFFNIDIVTSSLDDDLFFEEFFLPLVLSSFCWMDLTRLGYPRPSY
ncbi:hypothetical protein HRbin01_00717 [archaeon HR01]|nr:hypothetical protein HRbin01_00717 [archaeon HR01]